MIVRGEGQFCEGGWIDSRAPVAVNQVLDWLLHVEAAAFIVV